MLYVASKRDCHRCALKSRCCPKQPSRRIPRSIYEGARDMARQIAKSWEGRTSRRLRKKIEMLFAHSSVFASSTVYVYEAQTARVTSSPLGATAQNLRKMAKLIPMPTPRSKAHSRSRWQHEIRRVAALRRSRYRRAQDRERQAVEDGRIFAERVNEPFLTAGRSGEQFRTSIERAVALGWLWRHASGACLKITEGAALFASSTISGCESTPT
ncbi:transposase [Bradyrhizobium sp. UFLA05-153]